MQQPVLTSGKTPTGFIQRFRLLMMTQSINQSVKSEKLQGELQPKLVSKFSELICSSAESDTPSGVVRKEANLQESLGRYFCGAASLSDFTAVPECQKFQESRGQQAGAGSTSTGRRGYQDRRGQGGQGTTGDDSDFWGSRNGK